jgi:hypothetical protein
VTDMIKEASNGGVAYGSFTPTPQMVQNMLKGMIVGSRPYVTRDKNDTSDARLRDVDVRPNEHPSSPHDNARVLGVVLRSGSVVRLQPSDDGGGGGSGQLV